ILPGSIADLRIRQIGGKNYLSFTAPGDDANRGQALRYDVRLTTDTLTDATWNDAAQHRQFDLPLVAGTIERRHLPHPHDGPLNLGIRAFDNRGNGSALSNVIVVRPPRPKPARS